MSDNFAGTSLGRAWYLHDGAIPTSLGQQVLYHPASRKKTGTIGLEYRPLFNYRRETMGRLGTGKYCYICLAPMKLFRDRDSNLVWNKLFCPDCQSEYSISE